MNIKKATLAWLLILIVGLDVLMLNSFYRFLLFEKTLVVVSDLVFLIAVGYSISKNRSKLTTVLSIAALLPILYFTARYNVYLLREPAYLALLLKSLACCYVLLLIRETEATLKWYGLNSNLNYYIPLLIIIGLNLFYITTDSAVLSWDPARHARNSLIAYDVFFNEGIVDAWMLYDFYPPLTYIATIPFQFLFGRNYDSVVLSIILFWFPLGYYFTNKIFREVFNVKTGAETFLNFAFHSNVMLLSLMKQFMLDYQTIPILAGQFYFLFRSEKFEKTKPLVLVGLLCGLGFMIKQSTLVISLVMIASYAIFVARDKILTKSFDDLVVLYGKTALSCIVLGVLIVPWFTGWNHLFIWEMKGAGSYETSGRLEGDPYPYSIESFIWYFKAFSFYFTWPVLIVLLIGYFNLLRKSEYRKVSLVLLLCVLFVWLFFTLLWNKDYRYTLPVILFMIPGYVGLLYIKNSISSILVGLLVVVSLYVNFAQVFPELNYIGLGNVGAYGKTHRGVAFINAPLSYAIATSLQMKNSAVSFEEENAHEDEEFNFWNRSFYKKLLRVENMKMGIPLDSGVVKKEIFSWKGNKLFGFFPENDKGEYILFRDSTYDYYLYCKFTQRKNDLVLEKIGEYGDVSGEVKFFLQYGENGEIKTEAISFNKTPTVITHTGSLMSVDAKIIHSSGRWPLVYRQQFTGEIDRAANMSIKPFSMTPLRSSVKNTTFEFNQ